MAQAGQHAKDRRVAFDFCKRRELRFYIFPIDLAAVAYRDSPHAGADAGTRKDENASDSEHH